MKLKIEHTKMSQNRNIVENIYLPMQTKCLLKVNRRVYIKEIFMIYIEKFSLKIVAFSVTISERSNRKLLT